MIVNKIITFLKVRFRKWLNEEYWLEEMQKDLENTNGYVV